MAYKRILLKLSGESLMGNSDGLYDQDFLARIAGQLKACREEGIGIGVIVGAGNIWRGREGKCMDRCRADSMGMLATVINAIALKDAFLRHGLQARVFTATSMPAFGDYFTPEAAIAAIEKGEIAIFGGGSSQAFFSTDTAASLRAAQIKADVLLMAKNIDGIYDRDPNGEDGHLAQKYESVSCTRIVAEKLRAIDLTSAALNLESGIPAVAFALEEENSILRAAHGEKIGTIITAD
ncbi:MAG: uridine monophosphate kinase [Clostridia bacterium]|nr:uridine monophosphate kinase [Clostridia bacterium]